MAPVSYRTAVCGNLGRISQVEGLRDDEVFIRNRLRIGSAIVILRGNLAVGSAFRL